MRWLNWGIEVAQSRVQILHLPNQGQTLSVPGFWIATWDGTALLSGCWVVAEIKKNCHQTVEALQLHSNAQLLVQRVNHLLPALEGNSSRPRDAPILTMKLGSPVSDVSLHGDPDIILLLAWLPCSGHFTRLHANNVNSDVITHRKLSLVSFCSLQVHLLPTAQWLVRAPVTLLEGGGGSPVEVLQFHSNTQYHWSSGSTICLGAVVRIPGMHPHLLWNCVLLLEMSRYKTTEIYWEISVENRLGGVLTKSRQCQWQRYGSHLVILLHWSVPRDFNSLALWCN